MSQADNAREHLRLASSGDYSSRFFHAYQALVTLALDEPYDRENAAIVAACKRLSDDAARALLVRDDVDALLELDPPLDALLSHDREDLSPDAARKAVATIRARRSADKPEAALRDLVRLLSLVRNKASHGFKVPGRPRDEAVLAPAATITQALVEALLSCVEDADAL